MYHLRELEQADLDEINRWRNDPELIRCLGAPFRYISPDVDMRWYDDYMAHRGNTIRCAVTREGSQDILCLVSLTDIDYINQSAQFHIMVGSEANRGKGIGTFALHTMLCHAFSNMNLRRVELAVLEDNQRAQALYEKEGFIYEGTKRKAVYKNGDFQNLRMYSMLKDEFEKTERGGGNRVLDPQPDSGLLHGSGIGYKQQEMHYTGV